MIVKQTLQIYPNKKQINKLYEILELHYNLYNIALEQRIEEYEKNKTSISYFDQSKELTKLRHTIQEYRNLNCDSCTLTLQRVDRAFKSFFRRLKNKEIPGFPRFKTKNRFHSFEFRHGSGIAIKATRTHKLKSNELHISDIGKIKYRGNKQYQHLTPKLCTIIKKQNKWYVVCTYDLQQAQIQRKSGNKAFGLDWGVSTFTTLVSDNNETIIYENPKILQKSQQQIKKLQRDVSRKKKNSNNRKREQRKLTNKHAKVARQRKAFLHKTSSEIISKSALLAVEKLDIKPMTKKGKYQAKKTLNRNIRDTSPNAFHNMLKYKAEEAGIWLIEIDTRKYKPTQTCSECFNVEKKSLDQRIHKCKKCGYTIDRDINAARTTLKVAVSNYMSIEEQNSLKRAMCGNTDSCGINEALSNC